MGNILYSYMPENANKQHHGRNVIVFGNTMQQLGATCLLSNNACQESFPAAYKVTN